MTYYATNTAHRLRRGRSGDLWQAIDFDACRSDSRFGWAYHWDFVRSVVELQDWTLTSMGGGTGTNAAQAVNFGAIQLNPGAATIHHGRQMQLSVANFTPVAGAFLAMEMTCRWTTISTFPFFLFGFASLDTTSLSSGAIDTADFVGMHIGGTDGHIDGRYRVSSGTAAGVDDLHTIVDAADVKLGILIEGVTKASFWVNGLRKGTTYDLTTIPTAILTPTITHTSGGTVQPTLLIDEISVGYRYEPSVID
jgi:hypothetical protein